MIKIPSAAGAAIVGLFLTPLLVVGGYYIDAHSFGEVASILWAMLTFFVPVIVSVTDFSYWRRRTKELGSIFYPMMSSEDFKHFYFPAWGRMAAWFAASAVSMFALHSLGLLR